MSRTLDWASRHDPRSRSYAVAAIAPRLAVNQIARAWRQGPVLDQGQEGACVGFGWTTELTSSPMPDYDITPEMAARYALSHYRRAKELDEQAGEDYSGTSVLAGAQVAMERGFIGEYRWCFSMEEVRQAILLFGPVVIGIPWTDGMYETRPSGLVDISGSEVGGHCLTLTGFNPSMRLLAEGYHERFEVYRWRNSWGVDYGLNGSGYIKAEDLAELLSRDGEACVPMLRSPVDLTQHI